MSYAEERRKKIAATGVEGTKSAGKSCDPEATLRKGNLPKPESVRTIDRDANKDIAVKQAQKQNESLTADGKKILNVIPNTGKAVLTHPKGGE